MADINLLYEALALKGIEQPKQTRLNGGFTRWGKNNRYYAAETKDGEGFIFGDWADGWKESVFAKAEKPLTPEEWRKRKKQNAALIKQIKAEQIKRWNDVAQKARHIWQKSTALKNHEYLQKKQIKPYSAKFADYCAEFGGKGEYIVLPLYDTDGKIWSLEYINNQGEKRFLSGGRKKGCYCCIGKPENNKIIICEGFATGASIKEAIGLAVAVAFDCGNLEPVLLALMRKYPDYDISIAADNDIKENAPNTGLETAGRLKEKYHINVYIPSFKEKQAKCDFNDLMIEEGKEAVKAVFLGADVEAENLTEHGKAKKIDGFPAGYRLTEKDLLYIGDDDDPVRVSARIEVEAQTRNEKSGDWGKLVCFKDADNKKKELIIKNELFAGDGKELIQILLAEGLDIAPSGQKKLKIYLMQSKPDKRALCTSKTGWHKGAFVFPDGDIIGNNAERFIYQNEKADNDYTIKGTVDDWRENIGRYCEGNNRLILAVCAAFAAPLIHIAGQESGGFHFVGASSCGKSTALRVACSVYGDADYMKTWRATDNGLEGIAAAHNDTLLVLDELGQVDPAKAGDIAYMLGNGRGKARSNRSGEAKPAFTWRLLFLSSGEKDLSDCAAESNKRLKAGQEIRLLNIPAVGKQAEYGIFDHIHGFADSKAFADYLNNQVKNFYGSPAREFIRLIAEEDKERLRQEINECIKAFVKNLPAEANGQAKRALTRFALLAYAGEKATDYGLTGWQQNTATKALCACFDDWVNMRGGTGAQEDREILEQVQLFFEQHAQSRFYNLAAADNNKIINQAGFRDINNDEIVFYVFPNVLKKEICKGLNFEQAKSVLYKAGILTNLKATQPGRGEARRKWLYEFSSKIWSAADVG